MYTMRDAPSPPIWRKTSTTSTTPVGIALPFEAGVVKVWVDVLSYVSFDVDGSVPSVTPANAVDTITSQGTPSAGTFKLSYLDQITSALTYDESAADVDTALETLNAIGSSGVVSAGGALPTAVTVTWSGTRFAGTNPPPLRIVQAAITGGEIIVTRTTTGVSSYGYLEAGTQEVYTLRQDGNQRFLCIAAVSGTGNYRITAYV